jgi:hypothetical protein
MIASDRTKILFSTDRAADSGTMLICSRPSQPRVNPAYLREMIRTPPGRLVEFIDENGGRSGVRLRKRQHKKG